MSRFWNPSSAATWMAVGITSLDDCPMFTASFGWMGDLPPRTPVSISLATPAITSLVFMFVEVPLPVWKTSTTNCASSRPSATACAAWTIGSPCEGSSSPRSMLTCAAAFLMRPIARIMARGNAQGADLEVQLGAASLGAVVGVGRDLHRAHRVFFGPGRRQASVSGIGPIVAPRSPDQHSKSSAPAPSRVNLDRRLQSRERPPTMGGIVVFGCHWLCQRLSPPGTGKASGTRRPG